jgi:hypothetical protein
MAVYRVGDDGASVFDEHGRLVARLRPGAAVVPGTAEQTIAERTPEQAYPTVHPSYADKVIRPERGPTA